jgi:hypothetical protein
MTVKSKKRRLKRAHAHQALRKGRNQFHAAFSNSMSMIEKENLALGTSTGRVSTIAVPMTDSLKDTFKPIGAHTEFGDIEFKPPKRAKCPTCGFSQKVTKAGKMGRHDVYIGSDASQCKGSGEPWR